MSNIVAFSGGKDSTAMLLRMVELNYKIDKVMFADTTLEYPEIYEWIKHIESIIPYDITYVYSKRTFDEIFYGKIVSGKYEGRTRGMPYVIVPCWWQRDGKTRPMERAHGKGNNIYLAIATNELKRSKCKKYSNGKNEYTFPLIDWGWTEDDCNTYLESRDLKHPLKDRFKRTGCWLCPKQSLGSLRSLYTYYPDLWVRLKQYEKDSPHGFNHHFTLDELEERFTKENKITK